MEHKHLALSESDLKMEADSRGRFSGYASVFNGTDSDGDTILPGAYAKSLASGAKIRGFLNHDHWDVPLYDILDAKEDGRGLYIEGQIDFKHHLGESVYSAMERGAMDAFSVGFTECEFTPKDDADRIPQSRGYGNRLIKSVNLMEVSIVTWPADDAARISQVKERISQLGTVRDFEQFLREQGQFSKSTAKRFIGQLLLRSQGDLDGMRQRIEAAEDAKHLGEVGDICKSLRQRLLATNTE